MFLEEFGIDVTTVVGGGAAGGLGGALAALGGRLVPGFELVADELDLYDHLDGADLVITGEGRLDATSFSGKVVGGVAALAAEADIRSVAIVGSVDPDVPAEMLRGLQVESLADRYGEETAISMPRQCVEETAAMVLASLIATQ
jgi:glycerate kinase